MTDSPSVAAIQAFPDELDPAVTEYGQNVEPVFWGVVAFVFVYLLGRLLVLPTVSRVIRRRNRKNPTLVDAIERYTALALVLVAASVGVSAAGYGDVFAGSALVIAALTLALGVAGQEVIGNLVSGLFLVVDPDFNVDDWIEWDGGHGVVETIRFRVTRVRTENNEVVTVPNTTLATSAVTRPYSRDRLRVAVSLGVSYGTDLDAVAALLHEEIDALGALEEPPPEVVVEELGGDAVQLRVQFWLDDPSRRDALRARSVYLRRIKRRLAEEGIGVSPPTEHELSGALRLDSEE